MTYGEGFLELLLWNQWNQRHMGTWSLLSETGGSATAVFFRFSGRERPPLYSRERGENTKAVRHGLRAKPIYIDPSKLPTSAAMMNRNAALGESGELASWLDEIAGEYWNTAPDAYPRFCVPPPRTPPRTDWRGFYFFSE